MRTETEVPALAWPEALSRALRDAMREQAGDTPETVLERLVRAVEALTVPRVAPDVVLEVLTTALHQPNPHFPPHANTRVRDTLRARLGARALPALAPYLAHDPVLADTFEHRNALALDILNGIVGRAATREEGQAMSILDGAGYACPRLTSDLAQDASERAVRDTLHAVRQGIGAAQANPDPSEALRVLMTSVDGLSPAPAVGDTTDTTMEASTA